MAHFVADLRNDLLCARRSGDTDFLVNPENAFGNGPFGGPTSAFHDAVCRILDLESLRPTC